LTGRNDAVPAVWDEGLIDETQTRDLDNGRGARRQPPVRLTTSAVCVHRSAIAEGVNNALGITGIAAGVASGTKAAPAPAA